jgi:single-stranded-DNA-specific exonuclease
MIRDQSEEPAIVLASPEWHAGVVGIVAGRLCEQFAKPVILLSIGELVAGGSGRSIPGCPLHELLDTCKDELLSHGGHAAAAGLKLRPDRIDAFRDRFMAAVSERLPDGPPAPTLNLDGEVPLSALTLGLLKDIEKLEPYGADNPRPRFLASNLQIENPKKIGQNERHLSFRCRQGGTTLRAVAFGRGDELDDLMSAGGTCCLAFTPKKNEWNGRTSVELEVIDYRPGTDPGLG